MSDSHAELERIARDYHLNDEFSDKFIENACQQYCCDWLASLLEVNDRVLELGYGDGITLSRLSPLVNSYTVVEGAESLAACVLDKFPEVHTVHALFENYEAETSFQKVLALHVLEHVDDPVRLLRHMSHWIADDGELIVIVPNCDSIHRRLAVLMGLQQERDSLSPRDHVVGHQRVYGLAMLREHLDAAGYRVVEERGFFMKSLPNSMMLDYSSVLIEALNQLSDTLPAELLANLAVRAVPKN